MRSFPGGEQGVPLHYSIRRTKVNSMAGSRELRTVVSNKDGEQTGGLGCACILADEMCTARRFKEALARLVYSGRAGGRGFGSDRPRKDVRKYASCVSMRARLAARRVGYGDGSQALAGDVGQ